MNKLIFGLICLSGMIISQDAYSIQYFENNRQLKEINEFCQREEQREQARQQINIQKEMLNLQRQQYRYGN